MKQKDIGAVTISAQDQFHTLVSRIRQVESLFNYETDSDMLEAYIYELQSLTLKLDRLLKTEKQKNA